MSHPLRSRACGAVYQRSGRTCLASPRASLPHDVIYTDVSPWCGRGVGVDEGCGWAPGQPATGKQPVRNDGLTASLIDFTGAAAWQDDTRNRCGVDPCGGAAEVGATFGLMTRLDTTPAGAGPASAHLHPSQPPDSGAPRPAGAYSCHTPLSSFQDPPESRQGD